MIWIKSILERKFRWVFEHLYVFLLSKCTEDEQIFFCLNFVFNYRICTQVSVHEYIEFKWAELNGNVINWFGGCIWWPCKVSGMGRNSPVYTAFLPTTGISEKNMDNFMHTVSEVRIFRVYFRWYFTLPTCGGAWNTEDRGYPLFSSYLNRVNSEMNT